MERRDLLERLHMLSHYVNRGEDCLPSGGPRVQILFLARLSAGAG